MTTSDINTAKSEWWVMRIIVERKTRAFDAHGRELAAGDDALKWRDPVTGEVAPVDAEQLAVIMQRIDDESYVLIPYPGRQVIAEPIEHAPTQERASERAAVLQSRHGRERFLVVFTVG